MDLILWRHAEAEDGSNDLARTLTRKGQQQAGQMAAWLRDHLPDNYRVFASEAKRSQQTAAFISKSYKVMPELNPDATPDAVFKALDWPNLDHPVILVGHQPYIGQIAAKLLCGDSQLWTVKKGGMWWLQHRVRHGIPQTLLKAVMNPGLMAS